MSRNAEDLVTILLLFVLSVLISLTNDDSIAFSMRLVDGGLRRNIF